MHHAGVFQEPQAAFLNQRGCSCMPVNQPGTYRFRRGKIEIRQRDAKAGRRKRKCASSWPPNPSRLIAVSTSRSGRGNDRHVISKTLTSSVFTFSRRGQADRIGHAEIILVRRREVDVNAIFERLILGRIASSIAYHFPCRRPVDDFGFGEQGLQIVVADVRRVGAKSVFRQKNS